LNSKILKVYAVQMSKCTSKDPIGGNFDVTYSQTQIVMLFMK